jgi:peptide/nickel transport system ATP-binding protein
MTALLKVTGLTTYIGSASKPIKPVDGVSFSLEKGKTFALLGESGCGKSMTALSLLRLNPQPVSRIVSGQIELAGQDLLTVSEAEMEHIRGRRIAMIFQEPQSSLNPVLTVGQQIGESLQWHFDMQGQNLHNRIISLLTSVGIPDPQQRIKDYPHQLSGGMKQRVMIAIALAGEPELLIADEPTTALDVTIQAQILDLLKQIQRDTGMAILLISHDLAVVAQMADHVAVMYAGQIVETAPRDQFFKQVAHPYSKKLFEALPTGQKRQQRLTVIKGNVPALDTVFTGCRFVERCDFALPHCDSIAPQWYKVDEQSVRCHLLAPEHNDNAILKQPDLMASSIQDIAMTEQPLLTVEKLRVHFPIRKGLFQRVVGHVKAVDDVSLQLRQAETVALVGESGCGKTTVGKAILQLVPVTEGHVTYQGAVLNELSASELKQHRNALQIVFQDPYSSMNPRMTITQIIEEAMISGADTKDAITRAKRVDSLLERVGLDAQYKYRYPHEFSGGQRQRICIARALAAEPKVIVCDEPTSALDVSVQAQILNLLRELQQEFDLTYLFITHNIAVVDYLAHSVAVMYLGRIVEQGRRDEVLQSPQHPYTQALLAAVPKLDDNQDRQVIRLEGELPSPANPPKGCHFHQRCPKVMPQCLENYPEQTQLTASHHVRCFLY